MSFVYITEHGALIKLSGGKIIIEKSKKILAEVPKHTIDGLVLLSSVQITSQAIVEFLRIGVPVTWISLTQKFYGRLESMAHVNGRVKFLLADGTKNHRSKNTQSKSHFKKIQSAQKFRQCTEKKSVNGNDLEIYS